MPGIPLAIVSHPVGGLQAEEVIEKANNIIEKIIEGLREQ